MVYYTDISIVTHRRLMDLHPLERFIVLAQELNFTRAAEKLNIPQPHLSNQIKNLEKELEVTLFIRDRPLKLTPAGNIFLQEVKRLLLQYERMKHVTQRANKGEIGKLTIGINTSISNSLLPDILHKFRLDFPDVKLVLQELLAKESREMLTDGTIDVNFENMRNLQDIDEQQVLTLEIILQESLIMVIPENHPLAKKSQIWLQDINGQDFVIPSPDSVPGLNTTIQELFKQAGVHLQITQEATWMTTILSLVAGGLGISLLPLNAINLQRKGIIYREIQDITTIFELAVTWRHNNSSTILNNFLKVVREVASSNKK
jgi:DNA-binding transcriptional LysR family regulator